MNSAKLLRAQRPVSNFFGALGRSRETVLTSSLGYLLAKFPLHLGPVLLGQKTKVLEVTVEENGEQGRHDIIARTSKGDFLVEGKAGHIQSAEQMTRYFKSRKPKFKGFVLLDNGSDKATTGMDKLAGRHDVRYVSWQSVWEELLDLTRRKKPAKENQTAFAIAKEFCAYLEESGMAKDDIREVYCRELSDATVALYFEHGIYRSEKKWYRMAAQCQYFAPYFTARALKWDGGMKVERGITWVSRIRNIQVVDRKGIFDHLRGLGVPNPKKAAEATLKGLSAKEATVIVLGKPFRVFQAAVQKDRLRVRGALGARAFTFEELFEGIKKK